MSKLENGKLILGNTTFTAANLISGNVDINLYNIMNTGSIPTYDTSNSYLVFKDNELTDIKVDNKNFNPGINGNYTIVELKGIYVEDLGVRNI